MVIVCYSILLLQCVIGLYFVFEIIIESDKNHEENVRKNLKDE